MLTVLARLRDNVLAPFEAGIGLFPFVAHEIRIEQLYRNGTLVVRAELPGIDPVRDIDLAIVGNHLFIHVDRAPQEREQAHSEFRYGRLSRVVSLPPAAIAECATARYERGVLEVSLPMGESQPTGRRIAVAVSAEVAPTIEPGLAPAPSAPVRRQRAPRAAPAGTRSPGRAVGPGRRPSATAR